jgi:hypothetical protein
MFPMWRNQSELSETDGSIETPAEGIVASRNDAESWGSVESASNPRRCWFFTSHLMIPAPQTFLSPAESVNFTFEQVPGLQNGYHYRAIEVWR